MTTQVNLRRAEFVLTGFAFLGFITLLIRIKTVWGGLPAHPMFVHVPVVLIPVTVIGTLVCVVKPQLLNRHGTLLCAIAIVAMSSTFLAMQAGGALSNALQLTPPVRAIINEHAAAAHVLAIVFTLLTATLILTFAAHRIGDGNPTGVAFIDGILGSPAIYALLRTVLVLVSLIAAFYVFRVGDLGAKAVWAGRLGS